MNPPAPHTKAFLVIKSSPRPKPQSAQHDTEHGGGCPARPLRRLISCQIWQAWLTQAYTMCAADLPTTFGIPWGLFQGRFLTCVSGAIIVRDRDFAPLPATASCRKVLALSQSVTMSPGASRKWAATARHSAGSWFDSGHFPWDEHRQLFPMFSEPDASYQGLVYTKHFAAYTGRCRSVYQRTTGSVLSPLSAFLLLQGIETVALRVERHIENGRRVAEFLRKDRRVEWVNYAGFPESPYHALAQKYLGGCG